MSIGFVLFLTAAVIIVASYYVSPELLPLQVALIAGPTIIPFLVLPKRGRLAIPSWLTIASLLAAGWAYVVYVDTRPYQGGGASFAALFGWFTCFVGTILAGILTILNSVIPELHRNSVHVSETQRSAGS